MQITNVPNVWKRSGAVPGTVGDRVALTTYNEEQALFLQRLRDLVEKRRQLECLGGPDHWQQRLIDKALYSTYLDCLNLNVSDEAREILHRGQNVHAR